MTCILVVDDDSALRQALGAVLHRSGYHVELAGNGAEALKKSLARAFDAAVVDYQMAPSDGLEFLSQLRDIQPRCVRLLMSGVLDLPVVMHAINHGDVSRVVQKPFRLDAIVNALEELLAARTRREDLGRSASDRSHETQRRHLDDCLGQELLNLALQPIVAAADGEVRGYEALLRSRHPELNSAVHVIGAAEAHDAVNRLADRVALCARQRLESLPAHLILFVNMHPAELRDELSVRRRFEELLPQAHRVVLEITERSHILRMTGWQSAIDFLTRAGFRIAVDDVGAGYNSLSVLAELRPAFIKVDMSITRNIDREERRQRVLELLARFAKATSTQLIVEGIETPEEATAVKRIGADLLQGFLYGRPLIAEAGFA
jgi:EAL domain-containing protein (putative c-di-GMP-specific phosphodiesterase class I)/CheY-like chemotaxis protein